MGVVAVGWLAAGSPGAGADSTLHQIVVRADADRLDLAVGGGLDDGADDRVETGGVAPAREDADARDRQH